MDGTDKMRAYMEGLEEERRKIQVFQRELPLCMELVTQAIEACKKQLSAGTAVKGTSQNSEITDRTSEEGPVLEEFLPIRRDSSSDVDEVVDADTDDDEHHSQSQIDKDKKKSDWLRSVSLWNANPDTPFQTEESTPEKLSSVEMKDIHPTEKEISTGKSNHSSDRLTASAPEPATTTSSSAGTAAARAGGVARKRSEDKQGPAPRKQRRCWSPELHRHFVHALQQLGGSHATPKQIRELMKVNGLTNDEVKSHLQKYRLHTRRPSPQSQNSGNAQQPQFVVVGGIWVPPRTATTTIAAATSLREAASVSMLANNRIYTPVAAPATEHRTQQSRSSRVSNTVESEKLTESKSAATSLSTHTVTVC